MKVKDIHTFLNEHISPFAWQRVKLRLLPHFKKLGKYFHTISDQDELQEDTLDLITRLVEEMYNKKLNLKERYI